MRTLARIGRPLLAVVITAAGLAGALPAAADTALPPASPTTPYPGAGTVPWWEAITSPTIFSRVHGVVPVTFATDPELVSVRLDDGPAIELTGSGPWTTPLDLSKVPSGTHTTVVLLTYRSGEQSRFNHELVVDNDRPVIHDPRHQLDRTLLNQDVSLEPTVTDSSDRVRLDLLIDGKVVDTRPYSPYYLSWSTYGRRNGTYRLTLRATDPFGQRSEVSRTITVDTVGPTVQGLVPTQRAVVRGTFAVRASRVSDANGIARVELSVDGRRWGRDTTAPYGFTVRSRDAAWYRWDAYDKAGNLTSIERHIFVDTVAPRISHIKAPRNKARVRGTVKVSLWADDDHGLVRRVELLVNGKVVAKASTFPYRMSVNTRKQKKTMKVQFRAYDRAGNVRTTATRVWRR